MRRRRHPRRGAAAPAGVWLGVCLLPRLFAGRLPAAAFAGRLFGRAPCGPARRRRRARGLWCKPRSRSARPRGYDPSRARARLELLHPRPESRQQKMRSDGNFFPSGRKALTEGFKEAAAGGPE